MNLLKCSPFALALSALSLCATRGRAESVKQLVVWDGEQASKGTGWSNPKGSTVGPQTIEAHSGSTALEFKFKSNGEEWPGMGWNWCAFQTGPYGTDITGFKNFTFWMKTKGNIAGVQLNLLCNGEKFDMPEHHTEKVSALKYCPELTDGAWHQVRIPLADLIQPQGFDPLHVGELQIFNAGDGEGSFFIDDIGFEGPADATPLAAAAALASPEVLAEVRSPDEMLVNGSFANGLTNWVVEQTMGATAQATVVAEGPDGRPALRFQVISIADASWHLQFYQLGLRVEKGKTYVLSFWAKSRQDGDFEVNCQQNHPPYDHQTKERC